MRLPQPLCTSRSLDCVAFSLLYNAGEFIATAGKYRVRVCTPAFTS
jgi:hypothetical protein